MSRYATAFKGGTAYELQIMWLWVRWCFLRGGNWGCPWNPRRLQVRWVRRWYA